jgi:hypothetical protein
MIDCLRVNCTGREIGYGPEVNAVRLFMGKRNNTATVIPMRMLRIDCFVIQKISKIIEVSAGKFSSDKR